MSPHRYFPNLISDGYEEKSCADRRYNCIAWAANTTTQFWWPGPPGPPFTYWPDGVRGDLTIESFVSAFATLGYELCDNDEFEVGYEKVALYARGGTPTHMARQVSAGSWTSKLGKWVDIEHSTLRGLEGTDYGGVVAILKRRIP